MRVAIGSGSSCVLQPDECEMGQAPFHSGSRNGAGPFSQRRPLRHGAIRILTKILSRPQEQIEFLAFYLLLEDPKARLLARIEEFVNGRVGLSNVRCGTRLVLLQRVQPLLDQPFVAWRRMACRGSRESLQLIEQPHSLLLIPAPRILQHFEPRHELRKLLIAQPQRILRLHHQIPVKDPLNLTERESLLGRRRPIGRRLLRAETDRGHEQQQKQGAH